MSSYDGDLRNGRSAKRMRTHPTKSEALVWRRLRSRGLEGYHFIFQEVLGAGTSHAQVIVDFYCPQKRLAVEIDGASHQGREDHDRWRDRVLEKSGIATLRFPATRVLNDIERVFEEILSNLAARPDHDLFVRTFPELVVRPEVAEQNARACEHGLPRKSCVKCIERHSVAVWISGASAGFHSSPRCAGLVRKTSTHPSGQLLVDSKIQAVPLARAKELGLVACPLCFREI